MVATQPEKVIAVMIQSRRLDGTLPREHFDQKDSQAINIRRRGQGRRFAQHFRRDIAQISSQQEVHATLVSADSP